MLVLREKLDSRILQNTLTLNHASYSLHYSGNKNAQVKTILIFRLALLSRTRPCEQGNWDTWMVLDPWNQV